MEFLFGVRLFCHVHFRISRGMREIYFLLSLSRGRGAKFNPAILLIFLILFQSSSDSHDEAVSFFKYVETNCNDLIDFLRISN